MRALLMLMAMTISMGSFAQEVVEKEICSRKVSKKIHGKKYRLEVIWETEGKCLKKEMPKLISCTQLAHPFYGGDNSCYKKIQKEETDYKFRGGVHVITLFTYKRNETEDCAGAYEPEFQCTQASDVDEARYIIRTNENFTAKEETRDRSPAVVNFDRTDNLKEFIGSEEEKYKSESSSSKKK
jgi:hypothetical protein